MELLKHTSIWVKGEVIQGKVMLFIGGFILVAGIFAFNSNNVLLNGMVIPIYLIAFVLLAYGIMQIIVRPKHIGKVSIILKKNPNLAIENELSKATKDDKVFKLLKRIWQICIGVSIVCYFIFSKQYLQGLSIGLAGVFLNLFVLDTVLHNRLKKYLKGIKSLF